MKAIISNKIYMTVDQSLYKVLEKELTYNIPSFSDQSKFCTIKNIKVINYNLQGGRMLVAFPVGRTDLIPHNYEIVDKRINNALDQFPPFLLSLRDSQQLIYDAVDDNCLINAKVGWGKTICALSLASKLRQKTLIVTHTVNLRHQWEEEIVKAFGIKPGVIGSGKFNTNSPIVVANVQTLSKHINTINKEFGLLILDETHHCPAPIFSKVVDGSFARYKIGLSGTLERKDGKHVVLRDYFGSRVFKPIKENTVAPSVDIIYSGIKFSDSSKAPWTEKVTTLLSADLYRNFIVKLADSYANKGHQVLVVADRIEFLEYIDSNTKNKSKLLIGKTQDRKEVIDHIYDKTAKILCGTQSLVSEGLSINPLSCLILATPLNNMPLLEQLIGRIIRQHPNKLDPIIVDIKLEGNIVNNQYNNRLGHYMKEDYEIRFIK